MTSVGDRESRNQHSRASLCLCSVRDWLKWNWFTIMCCSVWCEILEINTIQLSKPQTVLKLTFWESSSVTDWTCRFTTVDIAFPQPPPLLCFLCFQSCHFHLFWQLTRQVKSKNTMMEKCSFAKVKIDLFFSLGIGLWWVIFWGRSPWFHAKLNICPLSVRHWHGVSHACGVNQWMQSKFCLANAPVAKCALPALHSLQFSTVQKEQILQSADVKEGWTSAHDMRHTQDSTTVHTFIPTTCCIKLESLQSGQEIITGCEPHKLCLTVAVWTNLHRKEWLSQKRTPTGETPSRSWPVIRSMWVNSLWASNIALLVTIIFGSNVRAICFFTVAFSGNPHAREPKTKFCGNLGSEWPWVSQVNFWILLKISMTCQMKWPLNLQKCSVSSPWFFCELACQCSGQKTTTFCMVLLARSLLRQKQHVLCTLWVSPWFTWFRTISSAWDTQLQNHSKGPLQRPEERCQRLPARGAKMRRKCKKECHVHQSWCDGSWSGSMHRWVQKLNFTFFALLCRRQWRRDILVTCFLVGDVACPKILNFFNLSRNSLCCRLFHDRQTSTFCGFCTHERLEPLHEHWHDGQIPGHECFFLWCESRNLTLVTSVCCAEREWPKCRPTCLCLGPTTWEPVCHHRSVHQPFGWSPQRACGGAFGWGVLLLESSQRQKVMGTFSFWGKTMLFKSAAVPSSPQEHQQHLMQCWWQLSGRRAGSIPQWHTTTLATWSMTEAAPQKMHGHAHREFSCWILLSADRHVMRHDSSEVHHDLEAEDGRVSMECTVFFCFAFVTTNLAHAWDWAPWAFTPMTALEEPKN